MFLKLKASGGSRIFPRGGANSQFFGPKLHENERILAPRGGARPWLPPLRSANESCQEMTAFTRSYSINITYFILLLRWILQLTTVNNFKFLNKLRHCGTHKFLIDHKNRYLPIQDCRYLCFPLFSNIQCRNSSSFVQSLRKLNCFDVKLILKFFHHSTLIMVMWQPCW